MEHKDKLLFVCFVNLAFSPRKVLMQYVYDLMVASATLSGPTLIQFYWVPYIVLHLLLPAIFVDE